MNILNGPYALAAKIGLAVAAISAIIGSILWYGHSKYEDGVNDTDAAYMEASRLAEEELSKASSKADEAELIIVEKNNAKIQEQKEKLAEAKANNTSFFDAIFPSTDGM